MKQLEVEMGQSMEMGTIHAGDFLVSGFQVSNPIILFSVRTTDILEFTETVLLSSWYE